MSDSTAGSLALQTTDAGRMKGLDVTFAPDNRQAGTIEITELRSSSVTG